MAAEQTELPDFTERTRVAHEGVRAAREGLVTAETAKAGKEAEAKAEYYGREREQIEPVFRQREKALAEVPLPKSFEPTQTNSQDLMSLFTLTGIAGMMLGRGGGRQAAVGAQQAMTGMINGYTAGRADLAERERKNFDTNVNLIRARKAEITDAFETALKEAQTIGMSAARSNLDQKLAAAGADILRAKVAVGDAETWVKTVESLNNVELKRSETQNRLELAAERAALEQERAKARAEERTWRETERATERTFREDQRAAREAERAAERSEFMRERAARDAVRASPDGAAPAMKPGALERKQYISIGNNLSAINSLEEKLQDKDFAAKIDTHRWPLFLGEEGGKVVSQFLQTRIPGDVREFVILSNALRNAYYLDISGKAVTGGEAMRNYGVVPAPGDSPEELLRKLRTLKDKFTKDQADYRRMYPGLPVLGGGTSPPAEAPAAPPRVSQEEFNNLPSGARFTAPDSSIRVKP